MTAAERIAEALEEHDSAWVEWPTRGWQCRCGAAVESGAGLAKHQAEVVVGLSGIVVVETGAEGEPFDSTPEQLRYAAHVVAGSFETGDWDRPRSGRKLLAIADFREGMAAARVDGGAS